MLALARARGEREREARGRAEMQRRDRREFMQAAEGEPAAQRRIDGSGAERQYPSARFQRGQVAPFDFGHRAPQTAKGGCFGSGHNYVPVLFLLIPRPGPVVNKGKIPREINGLSLGSSYFWPPSLRF